MTRITQQVVSKESLHALVATAIYMIDRKPPKRRIDKIEWSLPGSVADAIGDNRFSPKIITLLFTCLMSRSKSDAAIDLVELGINMAAAVINNDLDVRTASEVVKAEIKEFIWLNTDNKGLVS